MSVPPKKRPSRVIDLHQTPSRYQTPVKNTFLQTLPQIRHGSDTGAPSPFRDYRLHHPFASSTKAYSGYTVRTAQQSPSPVPFRLARTLGSSPQSFFIPPKAETPSNKHMRDLMASPHSFSGPLQVPPPSRQPYHQNHSFGSYQTVDDNDFGTLTFEPPYGAVGDEAVPFSLPTVHAGYPRRKRICRRIR
jgi:hypothetical protein